MSCFQTKVDDIQGTVDKVQTSMQQALQALEQRVTQNLQEARAHGQAKIDQALQSYDSQLQQVEAIQSNACTKDDCASLLKEAMAQQSAEFRSMLANHTPDPSPAHEPLKVART